MLLVQLRRVGVAASSVMWPTRTINKQEVYMVQCGCTTNENKKKIFMGRYVIFIWEVSVKNRGKHTFNTDVLTLQVSQFSFV